MFCSTFLANVIRLSSTEVEGYSMKLAYFFSFFFYNIIYLAPRQPWFQPAGLSSVPAARAPGVPGSPSIVLPDQHCCCCSCYPAAAVPITAFAAPTAIPVAAAASAAAAATADAVVPTSRAHTVPAPTAVSLAPPLETWLLPVGAASAHLLSRVLGT